MVRHGEQQRPEVAARFGRRGFLAGAAAGAAALAAGCRGTASAVTAREFDLDRSHVQLATFLLASHPRPVREAIDRHRRALDRNAKLYLDRNEFRLEDRARAAAARYLGSDAGLVALTDSTTMGLGLLYGGLRLAPGDEVVTTEHDFYSTHESLRLATARAGAGLRKVRLYDRPEAASVDEILSAIRAAVRPATRCLAITWVHSSTGVKLPVRRIAALVADANRGRSPEERVLLCVDGVHGFGVEDVAVAGLGCDFFSSGCHKWLFGPRGTGVLWGRAEAWARHGATIPSFARPALGAWFAGRPPSGPAGSIETPGGFHTFEHRWALPEAFAWHERRGRGRVARRTHALARRLKDGLRDVRGVTVKTPASRELSAGLVCVDVPGRDPAEVVERLLREHRIVASQTPYRESYVRFGPSILNDERDVDAAVAALAKIVS